MAKILLVLTSNDTLGDTGEPTGFWLEELAAPYYVFVDAGHEVVLATPKGGQAPVDPNSTGEDAQTEDTRRFEGDEQAQRALAETTRLADVDVESFDAVFYPGGHGPLWDLASDDDSRRIIEDSDRRERPLGLVCHAPAVLRDAQRADGRPLVEGREVTGFTDAEEEQVGLSEVVPFSVEEMLGQRGGRYSKAEPNESHVVRDGSLVTGQNPASSADVARALLELVG